MERVSLATEAALAALRRILGENQADAAAGAEPRDIAPPQAVRITPRQVAALPWRRKKGGIEVMLVTSRDTGRWVLPKGWPEAGETLWDAAAREAGEEAGLKGAISPAEIGHYLYDKARPGGLSMRCEVAVFPLEVKQVAAKWPEKGQRKRVWMSPSEAARRVREEDLSRLLAGFEAPSRSLAA
jgi:8-oxo-dGTP pyrophosphatase MutT (NUDIX family)